MSKHTPGPWRLAELGHPALSLFGPDGKSLWWGSRTEQEIVASARLCAAAPELLVAAKAALQVGEIQFRSCALSSAVRDKLDAAIAKAEREAKASDER